MALKRICFCILTTCLIISADLQDPFPQGFSMGNLGSVLLESSAHGRQPWISAAFCDNSRKLGAACGVVSYYDRMDNLRDESIFRAFGGVFYTHKKLGLKMAVSHFSALRMYYEQSGFFSSGFQPFTYLRVAMEFTGTRVGLTGFKEKTHTAGECGISGWIPFKLASIGISLSHITLKSGWKEGVDAPFTIKAGLHTSGNRFGAQGVVIEVVPSQPHPVRFVLGEQYRFVNFFAIETSLANNPFMIGAGISIEISAINASVSLVNHPVLGWSRGFAVMY